MENNTKNTNLVSNKEVIDIVTIAKNTGNFTNVKFKDDLIVSCIKTQENHVKCGIDISLDYGDGDGPIFHFEKKIVDGEDWKTVLTDTLYQCGRNFDSKEINDIANLAKLSIKSGKVEECADKMTLPELIRNLHDKAKEYMSIEKDNDSLMKVTLYDDCITLNGKKSATQGILDDIESGWTDLEFKKALKIKRLLKWNVDKYYSLIQTDEAKKLKVRKIIQIPLSKVENWTTKEEKNND